MHQDIQAKLGTEISNFETSINSLEDMRRDLPLLHAVFKETLRLHSPVVELHHVATQTSAVPISQPLPGHSEKHVIIPEDVMIAIPINAIQTNIERSICLLFVGDSQAPSTHTVIYTSHRYGTSTMDPACRSWGG